MENNNFGRRDNSRGLEISLKKKKIKNWRIEGYSEKKNSSS